MGEQVSAQNDNSTLVSEKAFMITVFVAQMFFGAWYLVHGLNYYVEFFTQPPGAVTLSRQLIGALIATGLFDVVKIAEIAIGILLLTNRMVPFAVLAAVPINGIILWLNFFVNADAFGVVVGSVIILVQGLTLVAFFPYYKSMFVWKAEYASLAELKALR